jgi:hypothetical protein
VDRVTGSRDVDGTERGRTADARLDELLSERARLWEEVHRLRAERREVEYYERLATEMRTSVSWRVTEPLRQFKRLVAWVRWKLELRRS